MTENHFCIFISIITRDYRRGFSNRRITMQVVIMSNMKSAGLDIIGIHTKSGFFLFSLTFSICHGKLSGPDVATFPINKQHFTRIMVQ